MILSEILDKYPKFRFINAFKNNKEILNFLKRGRVTEISIYKGYITIDKVDDGIKSTLAKETGKLANKYIVKDYDNEKDLYPKIDLFMEVDKSFDKLLNVIMPYVSEIVNFRIKDNRITIDYRNKRSTLIYTLSYLLNKKDKFNDFYKKLDKVDTIFDYIKRYNVTVSFVNYSKKLDIKRKDVRYDNSDLILDGFIYGTVDGYKIAIHTNIYDYGY